MGPKQKPQRQPTFRDLFRPGQIPGWLFVLSVIPWRRAWRAVEIGGDIQFLSSLAVIAPNVRDFIADWGWLPLMAAGFAWFAFYVRLSGANKLPRFGLTRVLATLSVLSALFASFYLGSAFPNLGSLLVIVNPITLWQPKPPHNIYLELDMSLFRRFSDSYKVGAACRVSDDSRDFQSSRLLLSEPRTIVDDVEINIGMEPWFQDQLCTTEPTVECVAALISTDGKQIRSFSSSRTIGIGSVLRCN